MLFFALVIEFFKIMRLCWISVKFVFHFGPDMTSNVMRGTSPDDIENMVRIALRNWSNEGHELLPYRYKQILKRLLAEGLIAEDVHDRCVANALTAIISPGCGKNVVVYGDGVRINDRLIQFPWLDDPDILVCASEQLREKIEVFVVDHRIYTSFNEAAIFLQTISPPE